MSDFLPSLLIRSIILNITIISAGSVTRCSFSPGIHLVHLICINHSGIVLDVFSCCCINHAMQMCGCLFNIIIFILSGSVLCSKHFAAMYFGKIAIREFISSFGIFFFICVYSQIPLPKFLKTILFNMLVLFLCRRLMLAPYIFLVEDISSFFY